MNISRLIAAFRKASRRGRGFVMASLIRLGGGHVGNRLEVEPGATLRWGGHPGIIIGSNVRLGRGVVLDVPRGGRLVLADGVKIMHYTVVAVAKSLSIGADTQVAEHCSLRDSDHGMDPGMPLKDQSVSTATTIGAEVWIGRGVAILRGSVIGEGAVIGANSLVRGEVAPWSVSVGVPAKHKKFRRERVSQ